MLVAVRSNGDVCGSSIPECEACDEYIMVTLDVYDKSRVGLLDHSMALPLVCIN
jgi:hypothetical protein